MIYGLGFYFFSFFLVVASAGVVFTRNPVHGVLSLILAFFNAAALFVLLGAEFLAMLLVVVYVGAVAVLFLFVVMMLDVSPPARQKRQKRLKEFFQGLFALGYYWAVFLPVAVGLYWGVSWFLDELTITDALLTHGLPLLFAPIAGHMPPLTPALVGSFALLLVACGMGAALARRISGLSGLEAVLELVEALPFTWIVGCVLAGELIFFGFTWQSSPFAQQSVNAPLPPADLLGNTQALASYVYRFYALAFQGCGLVLLVAMIGAIVLSLRGKPALKRQDVLTQVTRDPKECVRLVTIPLGEGVKDV